MGGLVPLFLNLSEECQLLAIRTFDDDEVKELRDEIFGPIPDGEPVSEELATAWKNSIGKHKPISPAVLTLILGRCNPEEGLFNSVIHEMAMDLRDIRQLRHLEMVLSNHTDDGMYERAIHRYSDADRTESILSDQANREGWF